LHALIVQIKDSQVATFLAVHRAVDIRG